MRTSFRLIVTFVSVVVLLSVLAGSAVAAPPAHQAKWTVMVYISGDNDLEEYVVKDIELELAPTGSSANVQVVALADRGPALHGVVDRAKKKGDNIEVDLHSL